MGLDGKVALVTGAGGMRTIGRAVAVRLARDGADIVVSDIRRATGAQPADEVEAGWRGLESVASQITSLGRRCVPIFCDVTQPSQVDALILETVRSMGRLDILVNSARAAIGADRVPIIDMDESDWDRVLAVNLRGAMTCSKLAARQMIKAGRGGRIINISSTVGRQPGPAMSAYACSKAALNMLTFSLAVELAPHQILATAVIAGLVDTNRSDLHEEADAAAQGIPYPEWRRRLRERDAERMPLRRLASPEDIAGTVSFLASDDAAYITGQTVGVSGGAQMF